MRSGYVHKLEPIVSQLRVPTISQGDTLHWYEQPYLTLSGLVRLTAHVLTNFIAREESTASEDVNWREQLPGIIKLRPAPQYWIHNATSYTPQTAQQRYSAFLEHLTQKFRSKEPIVDMAAVLEKIEQSVAGANESQRTDMLCLYWVYNHRMREDFQKKNWRQFLENHASSLYKCCIETLAARLALELDFEWSLDERDSCYEEYDRTRFSKSAFHLPLALEVALLAALANKSLAEGNKSAYLANLNKAILNSPGLPEVQTILLEANEKGTAVEIRELLFGKSKTTDEEPTKPGHK